MKLLNIFSSHSEPDSLLIISYSANWFIENVTYHYKWIFWYLGPLGEMLHGGLLFLLATEKTTTQNTDLYLSR